MLDSMRLKINSLRKNFLKYFYAWRVSLYVIGVVISNRFANYSITGVYMDFLTSEWNTAIYAAALVINIKEAFTSLFSIVGSTYASDARTGRYRVIRFSLLPFITGLGLFASAASKIVPRGAGVVFFILSLLLTVIGEGLQKHTLFDFGYDQFTRQMEDKEKAKLQTQIWWGAGRLFGTASGLIASSLLFDYVLMDWWVFGGMLSFGLTFITSIIFILGKLSLYKATIGVQTPIIDVLKVLVAAVRKRHLPYPTDSSQIYDPKSHNDINQTQAEIPSQNDEGNMTQQKKHLEEIIEVCGASSPKEDNLKMEGQEPRHTDRLRWLEKASIIESPDELVEARKHQRRLCTATEVKNTELVLRLLPLWSTFLMFQVVDAMGDTFFLEQGGTLKSDVNLSVLLAIQAASGLLVSQLLLPLLKKVPKLKDGIPPLIRIGIGMSISMLCCFVAALVEARRLKFVRQHDFESDGTVSMTIFWLVPQCFLLGAAVGFAEDGISDFFDTTVPPHMRVCYHLSSESVKGMGRLLSSLLLAIVLLFSKLGKGSHWFGKELNTSHLDIFYFIVAGMSAINLCFYIYVSRKYTSQGAEMPEPEGQPPKEDETKLPTYQNEEVKKENPADEEEVSDREVLSDLEF